MDLQIYENKSKTTWASFVIISGSIKAIIVIILHTLTHTSIFVSVSLYTQQNHKVQKVKDEGIQRIIEKIIYERKPVIIHNGLFDMLHIYDKFIE